MKMSIGKTLRSYLWWTHPRGNIHYDVMVTLILLFIFVTPHFVNFNDKPAERVPHQTGVQVQPEGDGFIYRIDAAAVKGTSDEDVRAGLMRVIEPIAGEVTLTRYESVHDVKGHLAGYRAWVRRR
ncbi:MAG TPA: hypothetical protein VEG32_03490 [Clostridia bacterium]|nr:hypothetical protein [Clostridia bacterium]